MRQFVLFSFLLSLFLGCTSKPEPPLVVASINWLGYQPLFLAKELNYFNEKSILLKRLSSASEVMRGFRNNVIDAATLTLDEAISLSQSTTDNLEIILIMDFSHGADAIIAKEPIRRLSQLKSKTIGVEKTALGAYMLTRALELSHLHESDIKTKLIEFSRHKEAFLSGEVDAIVTFDPMKTLLLQQGGNIIFDSRDIPNEIVDVLIIRESLPDYKRQQIQKLVSSWFGALNHINKNHKDTDKKLAKLNGLSILNYRQARAQIRVPNIEKNLRLFEGKKTGLSPLITKLKDTLKIPNFNPNKISLNNQYILNAR